MIAAIASLVLTTFFVLGSPGPAPVALAATSASYGLTRAARFYIGILLGLAIVAAASAAGLGTLFRVFPSARMTFEIIAAIYILYLAYRIATAPTNEAGSGPSAAPGFRDGLVLNIINPKSYAAFLAFYANSLLPLDPPFLAYGVTAAICVAVAATTNAGWLLLGRTLTSWLRSPRWARPIRIALAAAMVAAVGLALFGS